jgi:branched-chain amino acid transport system substrate-binding protein
VLVPFIDAAQVWVKYVNATKGGLNGHEVKLIVYDDGSDPARHKAQVQDAVERQRAVAFLMEGAPLTGRASIDYLEAKRVPVIGTSTGESFTYDSPMYFPQASSGLGMYHGGLFGAAERVVPAGKTKLGTLVCAEAQDCADAGQYWSKQARQAGFEQVYQARISLAQPDFTAECLAARNAGTQVLLFATDPNTVSRFAASCARQDYRPVYAGPSGVLTDRFKDDPNMGGVVGGMNVFPYWESGTPPTDEFHRVMKTYGKGVAINVTASTSWVAGKLLEKATTDLPEPPTSEAILKGLWSIKDDTLEGLTQPLTFVEDRPATPIGCWFSVAVENRSWVSGSKMACRAMPNRER